MSVCGQTEEESASEEPPGAPVREMYEQKAVSKVVRVLTVLAYLLSVSLAAILLSVYYVCVWKSPELPPLNRTDGDREGELSARRGHPAGYSADSVHSYLTGGSSVTISDAASSTPVDVTSSPSDASGTTSPSLSSSPTESYTPLKPDNETDSIETSTTFHESNVT